MKRVFILLNQLSEFTFSSDVSNYLSNHSVDIGTNMPATPDDYDTIVAWNYMRIIKKIPNPNNLIIFHSSDLPNGKGWAPIYNAISNSNEFYVVTGILAASVADEGDIVVKARFKIKDQYTAKDLRRYDNQISLLLIDKILNKYDHGRIQGVKQVGRGSYNQRRYPDDNEINVDETLKNLIPHLRACETSAPPYFMYNDIKYEVLLKTDAIVEADIPDDLEITFGSK